MTYLGWIKTSVCQALDSSKLKEIRNAKLREVICLLVEVSTEFEKPLATE